MQIRTTQKRNNNLISLCKGHVAGWELSSPSSHIFLGLLNLSTALIFALISSTWSCRFNSLVTVSRQTEQRTKDGTSSSSSSLCLRQRRGPNKNDRRNWWWLREKNTRLLWLLLSCNEGGGVWAQKAQGQCVLLVLVVTGLQLSDTDGPFPFLKVLL